MTGISIGDGAMALHLQMHNARAKTDVFRSSREVTSGRVADIARHLSGEMGLLSGLETTLRRIESWRTAAAETEFMLRTMQSVLGSLDNEASTVAAALFAVAMPGQEPQIAIVAQNARAAFRTSVALLNAQHGGRSVFAGAATDRPALDDPDHILSALLASLGPVATAEDAALAIDAWFAAPTGYAAAYQGSAEPLGPVEISQGETVTPEITAENPAIRDTLAGLAMSALLDLGLFAGNSTARTALVRLSGERLLDGASGRAELSGRIGVLESRVAAAADRGTTTKAALEITRAAMIEVDPYAAATDLETARTRLETLYAVTARVSRLNLSDYIR